MTITQTLKTEQSNYTETFIISVPGSIDMEYHKNFRKAYIDLAGRNNKYIIDLEQVKEMETCGLGMLLQMHDYLDCEKLNNCICLINCNNTISELLEIASFERWFSISSKAQ